MQLASDKEKIADSIVDRSIEYFSDDTIEKVGQRSFGKCVSLVNVIVKNAKTIEDSAFSGCVGIVTASFPSIKKINDYAFFKCSSMTELIIGTENDEVCAYNTSSSSGDPSNANLKIYVPDDLVNDYKSATNWSRLASKIYGISERPTT